ncbi:MAG: hypothetical protein Q8934_08910 [Bacillota bacterium]|nr:hypothetical protein [Bacillota bacterium]
MKIVCLLNSRPSFERIKNAIHETNVEWQLETSIKILRSTLATDYFELAIVDQSIEDFENFIELLELKQVKMLIFRGVYDDIIQDAKRKICEILKDEEEEERRYLKDRKESEDSQEPFKVMVKEVVKTERIEVPVYHNIANRVISVINLSERAGSSFVATNLARVLSKREKKVTLFESPIGTIDYYYTMGFYDDEKSFYSYRRSMKEKGRIDHDYLPQMNGIHLGVNEPEFKSEEWEDKDTLRLIASQSGLTIFDIGWNYKSPVIKEIINVSNIILFVIDPVTIQIVRNENRLIEFDHLKEQGVDVRYVFNRWDESIKQELFEEAFGLSPSLIIPFIEPNFIYNMYYRPKFKFLIDEPNVGSKLEDCFNSIAQELVPGENIQQKKKKKIFAFKR